MIKCSVVPKQLPAARLNWEEKSKKLGLTLGAPGMTLATDFLQEINSSIKL